MARTESPESSRRNAASAPAPPKRSLLNRAGGYLLALACGSAGTLTVLALCNTNVGELIEKLTDDDESPPPAASTPRIASAGQFSSMTREQLAGADIAAMNLACAEGLAHTGDLDVAQCLATLDQWARRVDRNTEQQLGRFRISPLAYDNSESRFRIVLLIETLKAKCGVRLDPRRTGQLNYKDPGLMFIHGTLARRSAPSGVTLPVLYAAVGRRLGYPLRLVQAKNYTFLRWDEPKTAERFNIEITADGLQCLPDTHYKTWPAKLSKAELASGRFLRSLTPAEELAAFLAARGHCLLDTGRMAQAHEAYATACRLAPDEPSYLARLLESVRRHTGGPSLADRTQGKDGKDKPAPGATAD